MKQLAVKSIVIVGGGTAGWMTAVALGRVLDSEACSIQLIESEADGIETASFEEATVPAVQDFHRRFGIDEQEFMRATRATFKLATEFVDWRAIGDSYMQPFGQFGQDTNGVSFHHYWLKQKLAGDATPLEEYALSCVAAKRGRFKQPVDDRRSVYSTYSYAYHLDASLYVGFLRGVAESLGVRRIEGDVVEVHLKGKDSCIDSVELESGDIVAGELFVDCSGGRGLLIEGALKVGYEDWRGWLPFDSALLVQTEATGELPPYSRATASRAGWLSRIPLQHRVANSHIYSSAYLSEDAASDILLGSLDGKLLADPELKQLAPGKRIQMWHRNCVAIGSSAGVLGPLESTGIFLVQAAITKLVEFFPDASFPAANSAAYNSQLDTLYEEVRDIIVLHFKATERDDSRYWDYCRNMSVPDELAQRMELFASRGVLSRRGGAPFNDANWLAVFYGQGIVPEDYDPRADCMPNEQLLQLLKSMREHISQAADALPVHLQTISEYCDPGALK
jgi:tryptophan halogenase